MQEICCCRYQQTSQSNTLVKCGHKQMQFRPSLTTGSSKCWCLGASVVSGHRYFPSVKSWCDLSGTLMVLVVPQSPVVYCNWREPLHYGIKQHFDRPQGVLSNTVIIYEMITLIKMCCITLNTHPEQWAFLATVPREQLGVWCLAQGHLSGCWRWKSHSLPPLTIPAGTETQTPGLRVWL